MIRKFFATEGAKLKEMNFTDKRQYIWEYYKLHIFALGCLIVVTGSIVNNVFINPPMRDYLYIAWQAGMVPQEALQDMSERLSVIAEDQERYWVTVRSYELTGDPQMDQAIITRFHAILTVGDLHAMITTGEWIEQNAVFGIIRPVDDLLAAVEELCPALYEKITDRISTITFTPRDEEVAITDRMAISLLDAPLFTEAGFVTEDLYLCIIINSDRVYETAKALWVMFYEGAE